MLLQALLKLTFYNICTFCFSTGQHQTTSHNWGGQFNSVLTVPIATELEELATL